MISFTELPHSGTKLPDHTQLPDSDGTFVKNFLEHLQSILLTTSIEPILQRLHPDGHYAIGQDSGIYWRWLRWWDRDGHVLPTGEERVQQAASQLEQTENQLEQARQKAEQAEQRAERLAALLRAQSIEPD
jgi:hypothetical protein